jgi:hypothetical protein
MEREKVNTLVNGFPSATTGSVGVGSAWDGVRLDQRNLEARLRKAMT